MVVSPCSLHNLPDPCSHGVQGRVGTWPLHRHQDATQSGMQVALSSGHQQKGRRTFIQSIFVVCLHCCRPVLGLKMQGGGLVYGGVKEAAWKQTVSAQCSIQVLWEQGGGAKDPPSRHSELGLKAEAEIL